MFLRLPNLAPKKRVHRTIVLQCASVSLVVSWILLFNGCSGAPGPGANNVAPGTPVSSTTADLTISATLPPATAGSGYSGNLTVSGGTAPYTFAVVAGQLPQGVHLDDKTGIISGIPAAGGSFSFGVSVSDSKGVSKDKSLEITVANATTASTPPPTSPPPPSGGNSFSNLQSSGGWSQYGQGPPDFVDCSPSPCNGISFSMTQGIQSPSMSGHATEFNVGGSIPYSDVLWNNVSFRQACVTTANSPCYVC